MQWISALTIPLVALGLAFLAIPDMRHPTAARLCFGAGGCLMLVPICDWGIHTTMRSDIRVLLSGIAFAVVGILVVEGLRWAGSTPAQPEPSPVSSPSSTTPALSDASTTQNLKPNRLRSSDQDILAREQLRELRRRQAREKAQADAQKKQNTEDELSKKRLVAAAVATAQVDRLRVEYIQGRDGISAAMAAGTEPVPDDWMNRRLGEIGVPFIYHGNLGGSYTLTPLSAVADQK